MKLIEWLVIVLVLCWFILGVFSIFSDEVFWTGLYAFLLGQILARKELANTGITDVEAKDGTR